MSKFSSLREITRRVTIISLIGFFLPLTVFAEGLVPCKGTECTFCHFFQLISNIVRFITWDLAMPIAVLMFMYGGIIFLTAGGSEDKVKQGKGIITQTLVGLVIVFIAWILVNTVVTILATQTEGFNPQTWYKFQCQ